MPLAREESLIGATVCFAVVENCVCVHIGGKSKMGMGKRDTAGWGVGDELQLARERKREGSRVGCGYGTKDVVRMALDWRIPIVLLA